MALCVFLFHSTAEASSKHRHWRRNTTKDFAPVRKVYNIAPGIQFLLVRKWKTPDVLWYWPHNDEYVAHTKIIWAYQYFGGYALLLLNKANAYQRNLVFVMPHFKSLFLDPNRMFQKDGIQSNLRLLNTIPNPAQAVQYAWNHIGEKAKKILLRYWSKRRPLIALHNNRYLSMAKYRGNPKDFQVAEFSKMPTSSFVFVLTKRHFQKLKKHGINVVYQKHLQHDGSLSDFAIEHHLPYINVETRLYYPDTQTKIIDQTVHILFSRMFRIHHHNR